MNRLDSKGSISHRTSRYYKDVHRFSELAKQLNSSGTSGFLGVQAEMIDIHDGLTAQIHLFRENKNIHELLMSDLEDQYFSCTNLLMGQLTGKEGFLESFRSKYQKVWRKHQYLFLIILQLFCGSFLLGLYIGWFMPEYATLFIGQEMMERIMNRQDWFNSLRQNPVAGGMHIALNNLTVCINEFFLSALLGVGGLIILIFNGFHVGFIISYCAKQGLHDVILQFVITHGILELTLIVVSCFAGMIMGKEFFRFPYTNFGKRFYLAAKEGFYVIWAVLPWICLCAVFEAIVSPWSFISFEIKILVGMTIAALFWIYTLVPDIRVYGPSHKSSKSNPASSFHPPKPGKLAGS